VFFHVKGAHASWFNIWGCLASRLVARLHLLATRGARRTKQGASQFGGAASEGRPGI
jgi:hypothetical protein